MTLPPLSLDSATTALVLIDLQYGIVAMNVHPQSGSEVVARARRLAFVHFKGGERGEF